MEAADAVVGKDQAAEGADHAVESLNMRDLVAAQVELPDVLQYGELADVGEVVGGQVQIDDRLEHLDLDSVDVAEAIAVHYPQRCDQLVLVLEQILLLDQVRDRGDVQGVEAELLACWGRLCILCPASEGA